jgi:hypothetical protein
MAEVLGWTVIWIFILGVFGVVDVEFRIDPHVDGMKTMCIRGKEAADGK